MASREELIEQYEELYSSGGYGRATRSHKLALNLVPAMQGHGCKSVMEIGCGRGKILRELIRHGFATTGTECVPSLLRGELSNLPVYPFMVHEMQEVPDLHFDLTLAIDVLDHLPAEEDTDIAIAEMFRMARLGVIIIVNGDKKLQTFDEDASFWLSKINEHHVPVSVLKDPHGPIVMTCWIFEEEEN